MTEREPELNTEGELHENPLTDEEIAQALEPLRNDSAAAENESRTKMGGSETVKLSPEESEELRRKFSRNPQEKEYLDTMKVLRSEFEAAKKAFEWISRAHLPTDKQVRILHRWLEDLRRRLKGLDESFSPGFSSRATQMAGDLLEDIDKLEKDHPIHLKADLTEARSLMRKVRAQYTSVQHTLTLEQRRSFRSRIASLAGLVREAEDKRWRDIFGSRNSKLQEDYLKSSKHLSAVLVMKITKAERVAIKLADSVLKDK